MAAIVWADVEAVAPTATDVDVLAQGFILGYVNITLAVARFDGEEGPTTKLARVYLAAHHATMIQQLCNSGAVTSDKAGGDSSPASSPRAFRGSPIGAAQPIPAEAQSFKKLRRRIGVPYSYRKSC